MLLHELALHGVQDRTFYFNPHICKVTASCSTTSWRSGVNEGLRLHVLMWMAATRPPDYRGSRHARRRMTTLDTLTLMTPVHPSPTRLTQTRPTTAVFQSVFKFEVNIFIVHEVYIPVVVKFIDRLPPWGST